MIILRERLAELLHLQSCRDLRDCAKPFGDLPIVMQQQHLLYADEIIKLFTDAIRNLEFTHNNLPNPPS